MNPGDPKTEPDDPFAPVDDDDGVEWADPAPSTPAPDPFDDVVDDDGTPDLEPPTAAPAANLDEVFDTDGTQDLDESFSPNEDGRITLPWRTTARIDGVELPALLAPSMPTSTWRGGPVEQSGEAQTLDLGGVQITVALDVVPGPPTLVLGRDALSGRIRIDV
ncbi:MAG: hypothetical protein AB8H79_12150 [Myxococcota bacterium]